MSPAANTYRKEENLLGGIAFLQTFPHDSAGYRCLSMLPMVGAIITGDVKAEGWKFLLHSSYFILLNGFWILAL
jgi:hypothetical protein